MEFDVFSLTGTSLTSECLSKAQRFFYFQFDGYAVNDAPSFFTPSPNGGVNFISTATVSDEGLYTIHAWENYYMPSETWLFSTYNLTINLEIKYDPCQASIIETVNWNRDWDYTITPENGLEETVFPVPYFTNNVTRTIPDQHCGPMIYTLGTIAQKADLDNNSI